MKGVFILAAVLILVASASLVGMVIVKIGQKMFSKKGSK